MVVKRYAVIKDEVVENIIMLDDSLAASWFDSEPNKELEELSMSKSAPSKGDTRDKTKSGSERFTHTPRVKSRLTELQEKIERDEDTPEEFREYVKLRDGL
jgi:hypothetical protein